MDRPASILLVDDSLFFMTVEKQFLKNTPATIHEARSGADALAMSREHRPRLVYMAYDLPDMTGAECCRRLKADPELQDAAVVLICDGQDPDQREACRGTGCEAVLNKPLDRNLFLEAGSRLLAGIRSPRRACLLRVRYRIGELELTGNGLDITRGGLFLESGVNVGVGASIELEITFPGLDGEPAKCAGTVAWRNDRDAPRKPNHPIGFGVQFSTLPSSTAAALNRFLEHRGS